MVPGARGFGRLDRLDVRLMLLLGLALLPIGVIAMIQTYRVLDEANARIESSLLGDTLNAAASERRLITRATGMARTLSLVIPSLLEDPESCAAHMTEIVEANRDIVFAGFTPKGGRVSCASGGIGSDLSETKTYGDFFANPRPLVTITQRATISGAAGLLVNEPVFEDSRVIGYVTLTVPHTAITIERDDDLAIDPVDIVSFDSTGTPLTSQVGLSLAEQRLPANRSLALLTVDQGVVFWDEDRAGNGHLYTVVPLVQGQIFTLAIWPAEAGDVPLTQMASAVVFPVLMWLSSLAVAYIAVHRLVIRHIRTLRHNIRSFSATRRMRGFDGDLEDVPAELREVIEAFRQMTDRIVRDEADQENMIHEKDVLLKEVHHRVKNNLQLIASITNMQIRKSQNAEARYLLRRLQDRVMGLATVHRNLYQASVLSEVRADTLIGELARQLANSSVVPGARIRFELKTDPVLLYPDQAVPLSLLVTESVTNAFKYLGQPTSDQPWVSVTLKVQDSGNILLLVANSTGPFVIAQEMQEISGLGSQLIAAFAMQLGGTVETIVAAETHTLRVEFSPADFSHDSDQ